MLQLIEQVITDQSSAYFVSGMQSTPRRDAFLKICRMGVAKPDPRMCRTKSVEERGGLFTTYGGMTEM